MKIIFCVVLILGYVLISCKRNQNIDLQNLNGLFKIVSCKKNTENCCELIFCNLNNYIYFKQLEKPKSYQIVANLGNKAIQYYFENYQLVFQSEKEVFINFPRVDTNQIYLPYRGNWKVKKLNKYRLELEADSAGNKWELTMDQRPPK